jgi:hypothetical protein
VVRHALVLMLYRLCVCVCVCEHSSVASGTTCFSSSGLASGTTCFTSYVVPPVERHQKHCLFVCFRDSGLASFFLIF